MPNGITDGNQMLIPMYHGTSRMFLASIEQYGLGAKDPNSKIRSYELFSELLEIMEKQDWFYDENLAEQKWIFQMMASQRVTDGGFNFRHGNAYLSPSILTAAQYASNSRYGSEFLSHTIALLEELEKHDSRLAERVTQGYPDIANLRGAKHEPLLIKAVHVPIANLHAENGNDVLLEIEKMKKLVDGIDPSMHDLMWQQSNYELIAPVSARKLEYYAIEWHGRKLYTKRIKISTPMLFLSSDESPAIFPTRDEVPLARLSVPEARYEIVVHGFLRTLGHPDTAGKRRVSMHLQRHSSCDDGTKNHPKSYPAEDYPDRPSSP